MTQLQRISLYLLLLLPFVGCKAPHSEIKLVCDTDQLHNYNIRWETRPLMDGVVEIYSSNTPNHFDTRQAPIATVNIADGATSIDMSNNTHRHYFMARFDKRQKVVFGSRNVEINGVQNFRDIGGYSDHQNRSIRWGMVYRSGSLHHLKLYPSLKLKELGIESVIDFTPNEGERALCDNFTPHHYIRNPKFGSAKEYITHRLENEQFRRRDAILYMQDYNIEITESGKPIFRTMFETLLDASNYPVVLSCRLGKDYSGMATALLMYALDINVEQIVSDYLLSNLYLDKVAVERSVTHRPTEYQEAVTSLLMAEESYITPALHKIEERYGSIDRYLAQELGMDGEKREILRSILLN